MMFKRLLVLTLLCLVPLPALAAGTCEFVSFKENVLKIKMTAHTDASLSATCDANVTKTLNRRWALGFCTYAGSTAPTSDSDIGMVDGIGEVWLTNSINGLNAIDDSTTVPVCRYFEGPNGDDYKMGHYILTNGVEDREIIVTWANNAVNSAVAYMEIPLTDREDKE